MAIQSDPRQVNAVSTSLLACVWIVALASIPSAQSYKDQLASGTPAGSISTIYGSLGIITGIASVGAWIITSAWLVKRYLDTNEQFPGHLRLTSAWARWGWIVPVVSLWFPKMIIDDLLSHSRKQTGDSPVLATRTWWLSWLGYNMLTAYPQVQDLVNNRPIGIHPEFEIASACALTASYLVWNKIVQTIGDSTTSFPVSG